jgi:transcriptional regulator with XRE-family HTH domain
VTCASPAEVLAVVCELSGISLDTLRSPTQVRAVSQVRAAATHLLRTQCGLTAGQMGSLLGRSAPTVRESSRSARLALERGGRVAELIERARHVLNRSEPEPAVSLDLRFQTCLGRSTAESLPRTLAVRHLRDCRLRLGLGQAELAQRAGITRETISRLESGRPARLDVVIRLANAAVVPPSVLTGSTELASLTGGLYQADGGSGETQVGAFVSDHETTGTCLSIAVPHLRRCRLRAGLMQPQLAQRSGMARETLGRLEHGRRTRRDTILRLADALLVAPSELTGCIDLDAFTGETYRTCRSCGVLKSVRGFVPVRGTPYVYLRCRACRARSARERYQRDPRERQAQIERAQRNQAKRKLAAVPVCK